MYRSGFLAALLLANAVAEDAIVQPSAQQVKALYMPRACEPNAEIALCGTGTAWKTDGTDGQKRCVVSTCTGTCEQPTAADVSTRYQAAGQCGQGASTVIDLCGPETNWDANSCVSDVCTDDTDAGFFDEDFSSELLGVEWTESGDGYFDADNDVYSMTHNYETGLDESPILKRTGVDGSPILKRTGVDVGDYVHTITVRLDTFTGLGVDLKWKTFGVSGHQEIVFNSFGRVRQYHRRYLGDTSNGDTFLTPITVADGDTLSFKEVYTQSTDTMVVSYSVNGGAYVQLYSGQGNGGFGDVVSDFLEFRVFHWSDSDTQPLIKILEWSLSSCIGTD